MCAQTSPSPKPPTPSPPPCTHEKSNSQSVMALGRTPEFCFQHLEKHEATIRACVGANEDTTRMRAIDTVLFDVLGWEKTAVTTERYIRTDVKGFEDYALFQKEVLCFIIEAKKQGETFVLPDRKYSDKPVGFALLAQECPAAEVALKQAVGYAAAEGARYVAISNGYQWIFALAFVPNQPLKERSVFVFESVDAIKSRFRVFWRCFGPDGVYLNQASGELLESRKAPAPAKLAATIQNYPVPADRNVIVNELGYIIELVWDDMNLSKPDVHFLRECYVYPDAAEDGMALAKELLERRFKNDEEAVPTKPSAMDTRDVPDMIESYNPEKPVIILGKIGHGKTTFLNYLRLVKAKDQLDKYIQIDVNFLDRPDKASEVADHIYREIQEQLLDRYDIDINANAIVRGVLHRDLQKFKDTPTGVALASMPDEFARAELMFISEIRKDQHTYLTKVFRHLRRGRSMSVALFLDNLDRRDYEIQEEAFLRASAMARDWECLVFVCLRPGTFYTSRDSGVMDSVAPKIITIVSPKTSDLLQRRFNYARQIAEGKTEKGSQLAEIEERQHCVEPAASCHLFERLRVVIPAEELVRRSLMQYQTATSATC